LFAGLFAAVMATTSCGDSVNGTPATPATLTGPSSLSELLLPRLSGNWGGEFVLGGIGGGTGPAIKAGDPESPNASDCIVARACTKGDYQTPGKAQPFDDLPHWVTSDTTCATRFHTDGGYAEMTV
jgi:hypothetical protein